MGGVASPLLANVFLHYVLDLRVKQWRNQYATGDVIIGRYADDFVLVFQHRHEAERFLKKLGERLQKFGLRLHPDKTRLIEFGRFAAENRCKRGQGKPETFDFLGFTHACGRKFGSRKFIVRRLTIKKRLRATVQAVRQALRAAAMSRSPSLGYGSAAWPSGITVIMRCPATRGRGDVSPRGLAGMAARPTAPQSAAPHELVRFGTIVDRWIPHPKILHPYPNDRFYAKHPK